MSTRIIRALSNTLINTASKTLIKQLAMLMVALPVLVGCATTNRVSTTPVSEKIVTLPLGAEFELEHSLVNGILTVTPQITDRNRKYRYSVTRGGYREKALTFGGKFYVGIYSLVTYGLALPVAAMVLNDPDCPDPKLRSKNWTKCSEISYRTNKNKENLGIESRPAEYTPDQVEIREFTADGRKVTIPWDEDGRLKTSLRELGFPSAIHLSLRYKDQNATLDLDTAETAQVTGSIAVLDTHTQEKPFFGYSADPLAALQTRMETHLNAYAGSVSRPYLPAPPVLDEVPVPEIPKAPVLVKDQFETTAEFKARVAATQRQYRQRAEKLNAEYQQAVAQRNTRLKELTVAHNQLLPRLAQQYQQRLAFIKASLADEQHDQFVRFVAETYGPLQMADVLYDADRSQWFAKLQATNTDHNWYVSARVPRETAMAMKEEPSVAAVSLDLAITGTDRFAASSGKLRFEQQVFPLTLNSHAYTPQRVAVAIAERAFGQPLPQPQTIGKVLDVALQTPESLFTEQTSYTYLGHTGNFDDDLSARAIKLKAAKTDNSRWLVVIGIEQYQFTDNIIYARRSAELFTQIAQKRLGIGERHTYRFFDQQASTSAIKDQLRLMLANVKQGDEIFFYYSGHGVPDVKHSNEPYLLPADKVPGFVTEDKELQLRNILAQLSDSNAGRVVAFLDSCFSAVTDNRSILTGVAASRLVSKQVELNKDKVTVMTAGRSDQFSNAYMEKGHRMFSYYLMESMLEGKDDIQAIYRHVFSEVKDKSLALGDLQKQEPVLMGQKRVHLF